VDWPKSTLPVRITIVLSERISNHEADSAASSEFRPVAAGVSAAAASSRSPANATPTMRAPPDVTNWRLESVAP